MAPPWEPFAELAWGPVADGPDAGGFTPAVDIFEDDDAVLVRVELPGVRPEDVQIDTDAHMLTVRGQRRRESAARPGGYHRLERSFGAFSRTFRLPEDVDGSDAVAVMSDGVLTVRIPRRTLRHAS